MKMKTDSQPIRLTISDDKEYGDVAHLVDQPQFLEGIRQLRAKWKITTFIPVKQFSSWKDNLLTDHPQAFREQEKRRKLYEAEWDNIVKQKRFLYPNTAGLEEDIAEELKEEIERILPLSDFEADSRDLRIKFNKPETCDLAIQHAIVCNHIPDNIYRSTYSTILAPIQHSLRLSGRTSRTAIIITPQTSEPELLKVYRKAQRRFSRAGAYSPYFSFYSKRKSDNIKQHRDWYWEWIQGKTARQLAEESYPGMDQVQTVQKAIKRYKQFLKQK